MNNQLRDKQKKDCLCKVLGLSDAEYKLHQIEQLQKYVAEYCKNDLRTTIKLLNSRVFENWFVNSWNRRNSVLYHKFCLSSYLKRQDVGRKVRISRWKLTEMYKEMHTVSPCKYFPSTAVWELINTEKTEI